MILRWWVALSFCAATSGVTAADFTEVFTLADGQSVRNGDITMTATGGFLGYRKGEDAESVSFLFLLEGASADQYAMMSLERKPGAAKRLEGKRVYGDAVSYSTMAMTAEKLVESGDWEHRGVLRHDDKWDIGGHSFFHVTLDGRGKNANQRITFVLATVGDDFITLELQCPSSFWERAHEGMKSFVQALRFSGDPTGPTAQ